MMLREVSNVILLMNYFQERHRLMLFVRHANIKFKKNNIEIIHNLKKKL